VIATDLTRPHGTVEKIGPTAHAFQLDVTQEEDWRSVSVKSRNVGDVDIVVNNAGYFPNRSIDELDLPTWRKTMATNLDAQFLSAKYFLPARPVLISAAMMAEFRTRSRAYLIAIRVVDRSQMLLSTHRYFSNQGIARPALCPHQRTVQYP
jgi:NAD(P)-dependent dehydrogenase (short-subunit alcohol dehydrogenase family)